MNLTDTKCVPCELGGEPLKPDEVAFYAKDVPLWTVAADMKKLSRQLSFKDFKGSLAFVNAVGELAEHEGHHPDFKVVYNKVTLELTTHAVGGLSVNDFIMAAKIDRIEK